MSELTRVLFVSYKLTFSESEESKIGLEWELARELESERGKSFVGLQNTFGVLKEAKENIVGKAFDLNWLPFSFALSGNYFLFSWQTLSKSSNQINDESQASLPAESRESDFDISFQIINEHNELAEEGAEWE